MKILRANAGALTNFEVLDFLRSRGAAKDPTRVLVSIAPSEFKVFDYLEQSAARDQTKEIIADFMEKSKKYDLAKAENLNILNIRPSSVVELDPIVEDGSDKRLGEEDSDELANLVAEVFPPPPTADAKDEEDVLNEQQQQMEAEDAGAEEGEDAPDDNEQQQSEPEDADVKDGEEVSDDDEMETS